MNIIVAIVGMTGSGKSTASECLVNRGWHHIRFGQVTIDRLKEDRREINPETEKNMREQLRRDHGMGAFALLYVSWRQMSKASLADDDFSVLVESSEMCSQSLRAPYIPGGTAGEEIRGKMGPRTPVFGVLKLREGVEFVPVLLSQFANPFAGEHLSHGVQRPFCSRVEDAGILGHGLNLTGERSAELVKKRSCRVCGV